MDRRNFFVGAGVGAAGLALGSQVLAQETSASPAPAAASGVKPVLLRLGEQRGRTDDETFSRYARFGITNVCANRLDRETTDVEVPVAELEQMLEIAARHGITIDMITAPILSSSHIDREEQGAIMMGESPQRDRDIEALNKTIENLKTVGIPSMKYNMSLLGVLRTENKPGRGGGENRSFVMEEAVPETPLTRAGEVDADLYWERITYFLDNVIPVATSNQIKMACHPNDSPVTPAGYQGIDPVLATVDGLKRFVQIQESPYHGLNFCHGSVHEMLENPREEMYDVIRWFGERGKIFNVHFRNIRGQRYNFEEVFPDEGDLDFSEAIRVYQECGVDAMVMPDHVPGHEADDGNGQGFAFVYGYIRALLQNLEREQRLA